MPRRVAAGRVATMTMIWRATLGAVTISAAAAVVFLSVPTPAIATPTLATLTASSRTSVHATNDLSLPKLTGPHAVGRNTLHLVDPTRPDPWLPQSGPRQLMVDIYYPAIPGTGTPASYMNTTEATALLTYAGLSDTLAPATLAAMPLSLV